MATQYTQTSAHGASAVVHRDHVGFVIRRKYQAINAVARQTKTRIQVNDQDKGCPFVTFVIGGRSVEDVQSAHHGVMELARRAEWGPAVESVGRGGSRMPGVPVVSN